MLNHHLWLDVACNFSFASNGILVVHVNYNLFLVANYSHKFVTSQNQHWFGTYYQFSTSWVNEGVQRHFCMDLQKFEGHTTRYNSTSNWVEYINTTYSSNKVLVES
jgi:plastocyanin domain-containing protein